MTLVQSFLSKHRGKQILLDANLWILLLVGNKDKSKISADKRINSYTEKDFDILKAFIGYFKLVATPNILTEVSNLTNDVNDESKQNLLEYFGKLIEIIDENYVPSKSVNIQALRKFGLSDSVIFNLAKSGMPVLTADFPLYGYLSSQGLNVLNFNHIRTEYLIA